MQVKNFIIFLERDFQVILIKKKYFSKIVNYKNFYKINGDNKN